MLHAFSRTELLLGAAGMERLKRSQVAIFGVGGVGSYAAEALVRSGVEHLVLVDHARISLTNLNRQIHATSRTVGQFKVDAMKERLVEINPAAEIITHQQFYNPGSAEELVSPGYDYIIDCIDTVTGKLDLILAAKERDIPIISCMGAGNKLDPTRFEVTDLSKTKMCPLARVLRKELRKRGVHSLKVVYSREDPIAPLLSEELCGDVADGTTNVRRQIPGSVSFVPSVAGLILAGEVVRDLVSSGS